MGAYAEQIANLRLVKLLEECAGRDDVSATDVKQLHANVLKAADAAGPLLERIPVTFKQYTEHNLSHSANLIRLMGKFIPGKTQEELNALEIAVMIFAALLHDLGMFVTDEERNQFLASAEFGQFLNAAPEKQQAIADAHAAGKHVTARVIEDAVLADYFRRLHPQRARMQIEQQEDLRNALRFREFSLVEPVAKICESHGWGVYESTDPRHPEKTIQKLKPRQRIYDVRFNEQYIASVLRLADIMDFDRSRTPLALLRTIDFTEAKSQAEWQKHLQIKGWEVTDRDVAFQAECTKPEHYVAVMEFIEWIDAELRDCRRLLVRDAPNDVAERYLFQLPPAVDRIHVEMEDKSFIAGAFRFELDYERVMKLLMDRSLYPDPSLFLRELLQNSLDACRVRTALAQYEGAENRYEPHIAVWDRTSEPNPTIVFQDNGVGMSRATIQNYFMRVGRSYYRSNEFHAERKRLLERGVELEATSQFGIGFLSCFMVADRIEIETYRHGYQRLSIAVEGATKYFTMKVVDPPPAPEFLTQGQNLETDGPPVFPGTRVTLHLRPEAKVNVLQTLRTFAVNVEVPITVVGENETKEEIKPWGWRGSPMQFVLDLVEKESTLEVWNTVLVPMELPLKEYDFCDGFDGKAWFWMLRAADGSPTPRLNWLAIRGMVTIAGLPEEAVHAFLYQTTPNVDVMLPLPLESKATPALRSYWDAAEPQIREKLLATLRIHSETHPWWYEDSATILALANADPSWLTHRVQWYGNMFNWATHLALHGIALPGGITRWDPMQGQSEQALVIDFPAGFAIDVRKDAPTPAANRLFAAPRDAAQVGSSLTRAFIRFAASVAGEHRDAPDWMNWFAAFVESLEDAYWRSETLRSEFDRVSGVLRLRGWKNGEPVEMSFEEIGQTFGRYVPVSNSEAAGFGMIDSGATGVLLSNFARIERDGVTYYDLDTEAELKPIG